jgi:hypothetical protein
LWTITREKELEKIEEELDKYQSIIERLVDPSR